MHTSQCSGASSGFMPELKVASGKQERNKNIDFFPRTCETEAFSITCTVCIRSLRAGGFFSVFRAPAAHVRGHGFGSHDCCCFISSHTTSNMRLFAYLSFDTPMRLVPFDSSSWSPFCRRPAINFVSRKSISKQVRPPPLTSELVLDTQALYLLPD